jgi:hypothetical protein
MKRNEENEPAICRVFETYRKREWALDVSAAIPEYRGMDNGQSGSCVWSGAIRQTNNRAKLENNKQMGEILVPS